MYFSNKADLEKRVKWLREMGVDIKLEWVMRRPKAVTQNGMTDLTQRMTKQMMAAWLDGYVKGFEERGKNK